VRNVLGWIVSFEVSFHVSAWLLGSTVYFPHIFNELPLCDPKLLGLIGYRFSHFREYFRVELMGSWAGFAPRLFSRGSINKPPSLSDFINASDLFY
jgi:hypothetical protein